jgi:hypothetical protein
MPLTVAMHCCGEKSEIRTAQTVIDGAPSSIIAGQSGGGRLRRHRRHKHERRHNLGHKAHLQISSGRIPNNTVR